MKTHAYAEALKHRTREIDRLSFTNRLIKSLCRKEVVGMKAHAYVVHQCRGCDKVDNSLCKAYKNPGAWFRNGKSCPLASHNNAAVDALKAKLVAKARVGQQKHKKTYKF